MMQKKIKPPGPILRDIIGAPFKLGGKSKDEGYDGFSFFYLLNKRRGFDMPFSFDFLDAPDVNFDNYAELWERDPERIESLIWSYILALTEPLDSIRYLMCGNVVVVKDKDGDMQVCIWLGNGLVGIATADYGVQALDRRYFDIVEGRRWASL
jgi:hypothetical protein